MLQSRYKTVNFQLRAWSDNRELSRHCPWWRKKMKIKTEAILTLPILPHLIIRKNKEPTSKNTEMSVETNADTILQLIQHPPNKERGFRLLMTHYGPCLYWHIRRIVVGHEDAEDVFQETSIKVFRNIDGYRGTGKQLRSWLYQIATNEALQSLRRRTHLFQRIDSLAPSLTETLLTENAVEETNPEMALQKALLTLPTTQRIVFNMRYFDDMTYEEIAKVTGKRIGTLKTNYHYASERIKTILKENPPL